MTTSQSLHELAHTIQKAQDDARLVEPFAKDRPTFDLPAAYDVAALIRAARLDGGARIVGRKIGFTNPQLWDQFGVRAPIWGSMYEHSVVAVQNGHVSCTLAPFSEPRIEPEIVFHFHSTPPADADQHAVLECVDWIAHGFEIVQSHLAGWRFTAAEAVADGSLHGALLLGERCAVDALGQDASARLEGATVELHCDGELREIGSGANVMGNPLNAVVHLVAELTRQGRDPIAPGELVTTGSMTAAYSVAPGQRWTSMIGNIPLAGISVEFV